MKRAKQILVPSLIALFVLGGALALTWAADTPALSGITVEDEHPNGCVDCHRNAGEGKDYRLNGALEEMDHPDVSALVKTVPQDCGMCHKAGTPTGSLSLRVHKIHYEEPSENHFIAYYQGECLACHTLNTATGVMSVKNGPKNW